jgi:hydrogenase/urease accessory protein HupE
VRLKLNLLELGYVDADGNGFISYDELNDSIRRIYEDVNRHYVLSATAQPIKITLESYDVIENHIAVLGLIYQFPNPISQLSVTSTLFQITQPSHQHLISANIEGTVHEEVLNASRTTVKFDSGTMPAARTFWSFLRLGVMHIFTGYDHLAFLVSLLIVTMNLRSLIKIVTSFTVAHSITLALATFEIVVLPSRLTESVIALSIGYVASENLLGKQAMKRYRIVFLFGLAHGFGFSNILREMELSRSHLALSLFSFNLGVELGQLSFVILLFPLIVYISSSRWRQPFEKSVSIVVFCLALYWFVRRAFLT